MKRLPPQTPSRFAGYRQGCRVGWQRADEYAAGHIPGAKLLPLVVDRAAEVLPDKNALWLVYCRTGRRSADAVQKLEALTATPTCGTLAAF